MNISSFKFDYLRPPLEVYSIQHRSKILELNYNIFVFILQDLI